MNGWCIKYNSFERIHGGLSPDVLKNEIRILNWKLEKLEAERDVLHIMSKFEINEAENIRELIAKNQNYLYVISGKTSIHTCMKCGSNEVFPMEITPKVVHGKMKLLILIFIVAVN